MMWMMTILHQDHHQEIPAVIEVVLTAQPNPIAAAPASKCVVSLMTLIIVFLEQNESIIEDMKPIIITSERMN